ncbi:hypothetical protein B0T16DRAFT_463410 [Cercophora newfieldiana]|uniref:F-box domain-containing protein n=1 Tax=Cercophora newfieldiana TaxID=92897 RepID=A0AA40CIM3_9PEZI|nr:hypothetical protein B0T16DRAFT_463410 [Cercophora newfieldiana]
MVQVPTLRNDSPLSSRPVPLFQEGDKEHHALSDDIKSTIALNIKLITDPRLHAEGGKTAAPARASLSVTPWTGRKSQASKKSNACSIDPLVADIRHNMECSSLCSLPDKLLLKIMGQLDLTSLQCLRRTCRTFLRLSSSSQRFRSHHTNDGDDFRLPWQSFSFWTKDRELIRRLERDSSNRRCLECRDRVTRWSWHTYQSVQSLMQAKPCGACEAIHPLAYFSRTERRHMRPRSCIGREGHVRLCEHKVLQWHHVVAAVNRLRETDSQEPTSIALVTCRHPSHLPTHHDSTDPELYPSIIIEHSSSTTIQLAMKWSGHMHLPKRPESGKRFTPTEIAHQLDRFRRGTPAECIAPQSAPGCLPEMKCFDPNRCRCLHYVGFDHISRGWRLARPTPGNNFETCRTDDNARLHALLRPGSRPHAATAPSAHTSQTLLSYPLQTPYGISISISSCSTPDTQRCLNIIYRRTILIADHASRLREAHNLPISHSWMEAIHPNSYRRLMGDDGKDAWDGLACREDPSCANHWRYLERPVLRACALRFRMQGVKGGVNSGGVHVGGVERGMVGGGRG